MIPLVWKQLIRYVLAKIDDKMSIQSTRHQCWRAWKILDGKCLDNVGKILQLKTHGWCLRDQQEELVGPGKRNEDIDRNPHFDIFHTANKTSKRPFISKLLNIIKNIQHITIFCMPLAVRIYLAWIKPYKTSAAVSIMSCCSSVSESIKMKMIQH